MRNQKMRDHLPELERKKIVELAHDELRTDNGKEALSYLLNVRNLSDKVIDAFNIGYVPHWVKNLYDDKHEFAGRIIFPVYDHHGELIAISSRDWRVDAGMKFFHETYKKRDYLFGLNIAKKNILKYNKAIVVEGEIDVLRLHSEGINCTVGMIGSVLHLEQIALLSRYCQNIFLPFDGDSAGQDAIKKAMNLSNEKEMPKAYDLYMVPAYLPDGIDPDEFISKSGAKKFLELLKQSAQNFK